jgi:hypothetical protein
MGLFYTNITLLGASQAQVAQYLKRANRTAYVSPTVNGFTVVYDKETEDQDVRVLTDAACRLSKKFKCATLAALVHDSDVFTYWLFEAGRLVDEFDSMPGHFDPGGQQSPPSGGNAEALCSAFGVDDAVDQVSHIFQVVAAGNLSDDWSGDYLFGEDIHRDLAAVLEMPPFAAGVGYDLIEVGEIPKELDKTKLLKCP